MKEHEVPIMPLKSRISTFTVEYGAVERDGSSLVVMDKTGTRAQIPVGCIAALMLEPGTTITHEAIKLCAEHRTLILWTGEGGVRVYSAGQEGAAHSYRLLRQARLALNPKSRLAVVKEMYHRRFDVELPRKRSIEQLRGMEGARVRKQYRELSDTYNIPWDGRHYDRNDWGASDTINKAISAANSCLYGICHAAVLIAGYSAAIGFIHTGYPLAFVHDVADIYKLDIAVPVAFRITAESAENVSTRARHALRDEFRNSGFLERIIPDIESILNAGETEGMPPEKLAGAVSDHDLEPGEMPWYGPPSAVGANVGRAIRDISQTEIRNQ